MKEDGHLGIKSAIDSILPKDLRYLQWLWDIVISFVNSDLEAPFAILQKDVYIAEGQVSNLNDHGPFVLLNDASVAKKMPRNCQLSRSLEEYLANSIVCTIPLSLALFYDIPFVLKLEFDVKQFVDYQPFSFK